MLYHLISCINYGQTGLCHHSKSRETNQLKDLATAFSELFKYIAKTELCVSYIIKIL